jgi:hypothetical protein
MEDDEDDCCSSVWMWWANPPVTKHLSNLDSMMNSFVAVSDAFWLFLGRVSLFQFLPLFFLPFFFSFSVSFSSWWFCDVFLTYPFYDVYLLVVYI